MLHTTRMPSLATRVDPVVEVVDLVDHHVATVAAAVEEAPGGRVVLDRGDDLDELVADGEEGIVEAELGDRRIAEADPQPEALAELVDHRVELPSHQHDLTEPDHLRTLELDGSTAMMGACSSATTSWPGWCSPSAGPCSSATSLRSCARRTDRRRRGRWNGRPSPAAS